MLLQFGVPNQEKIDRLLCHIQRGPTWQFHALLRSCYLTDQEHVITMLGFDPKVYSEEKQRLHIPTILQSNQPYVQPNSELATKQTDTYQLSHDVVRGKIKLIFY